MSNSISSLIHVQKTLSTGATVLVLNDGAIITSEDRAMIQALHSRSPKGILEHLKTLADKGSGNMMASFYVGYGHKSIGDCGSSTLFIENVSMLAAKAIQDSQLYNGQECSTRYIDYSTQPFFNPFESDKLAPSILTNKLRDFYIESLPVVISQLKTKHPKQETETQTTYNKAIKARAFDILRGFLPAGATTNVAWTTTLRQIADRLVFLRNHPLEEVRILAQGIQDAVSEMYPNSFGQKRYEQTESFVSQYMAQDYFVDSQYDSKVNDLDKVNCINDGINTSMLPLSLLELLKNRPAKTEIPKSIGVCGTSTFQFSLDFGSWRDIQRHRAVVQLMPLLTCRIGFESWYYDNLPASIQPIAKKLLREVTEQIELLSGDMDSKLMAQYLIPMGYKVPVILSGDLPALTYLVEIRASKMVHATLQSKAIELGKILIQKYQLPVYFEDNEVGAFDSKRGKEDIEER